MSSGIERTDAEPGTAPDPVMGEIVRAVELGRDGQP